jgi:site-specific recombinase XerD
VVRCGSRSAQPDKGGPLLIPAEGPLRQLIPVSVVSLKEAETAAADFAKASKSAATRRAYQSDAAHFAEWCHRQSLDPLPASIDTVVAYLAALAHSGLKASTITRRRAAIAYMHRMAGLESPTTSEGAKAVLAGIRRSIGTAVERKAPITAKAIRAMLDEMPDDLRGRRDRALLLIGFAGALRRSELVALDVEDIEEGSDGIFLRIRRSKTDQEGQGDFVSIPNGFKLRPVEALKAWLEAGGLTEGPIFRSIKKGGQLIEERLTDRSVADILKKRSAAAGLDPKSLSGHSLRSGFVTEALANGADVFRVMDVTRHKQVNTLKIYDRRAKAFQDHAGAAFL